MAIAYRGSTQNSAANGADVTLTLSNITGLAEDDVVILAYGIGDNDSVDETMAIQTGSGWTKELDLFRDHNHDPNLGVFWKAMGATPDTSVTVDGLGGIDASVVAIAMAFSGVDTVTPMDVTPDSATGNLTFDADPGSIDYADPNAAVVIIGMAAHNLGGGLTATFPTGYTSHGNGVYQGANDATDSLLSMSYNLSPSDPENPGLITLSGTDSITFAWCAATLALREGVTSVTIPVPLGPLW